MENLNITAPYCFAAGAIFPPLCALFVGLRFYTRRTQGLSYGVDDWLMIPAWILTTGICVALIIGTAKKATGYPDGPLLPDGDHGGWQYAASKLVFWMAILLGAPALTCIKLSFLFFFKRIFRSGISNAYRIALHFLMAFIGLWGFAYSMSFLFICGGTPSWYWTSLEAAKDHCVSTKHLLNSYGILDIITDVAIILMPIKPILNLHMSWSRRWQLLAVFGLGALSVVVSILRTVFFFADIHSEFGSGPHLDFLETSGAYWAIVETGVALIACCLPTLQGLFRTTVSRKRSRSGATGSAGKDPEKGGVSVSNNSVITDNDVMDFADFMGLRVGVQRSSAVARSGTPPDEGGMRSDAIRITTVVEYSEDRAEPEPNREV